MPYLLELELADAEGAIARVLDVIERRGFRLRAINGQSPAPNQLWQLALHIEGERCAENLALQLGKLHDCHTARIRPL